MHCLYFSHHQDTLNKSKKIVKIKVNFHANVYFTIHYATKETRQNIVFLSFLGGNVVMLQP